MKKQEDKYQNIVLRLLSIDKSFKTGFWDF